MTRAFLALSPGARSRLERDGLVRGSDSEAGGGSGGPTS
jgi:hypothetical protein